ncbi:hypothetical protein OHT57_34010 [Streptomyces sp. NBC_00285]|uniref:hypothetical protein n=1 Tax=Streptomyces sp. NBC_00285 TaxID=2975700 RepID=UPI002E2B63E8|nr:hypothetical protein [Streptomyces sp. NBC_00285]
MQESFSPAELAQICQKYRTHVDAMQLLDAAGFPSDHAPSSAAFTTASSFWKDVNRQLSAGRMVDGRNKIWAQVLSDFPAIQFNATPHQHEAAASSQDIPVSSGGQATTQTRRPDPPGSASSQEPPGGSKIAIIVASIGAGAVIVAALIAAAPILIGEDEPEDKESPSPSAPVSASVLVTPDGPPLPPSSSPTTRPQISINPASGPGGITDIKVRATGFVPNEDVKIEFDKGTGLTKFEGPYNSEHVYRADKNGVVAEEIPVPGDSVGVCCSGGKLIVRVTSVERHSKASDQTPYTLT